MQRICICYHISSLSMWGVKILLLGWVQIPCSAFSIMSYVTFCIIIISVQLKRAARQQELKAVCMVLSVLYLRQGASAGGFLWKAPGCENRASQSGPRGCVNRGSSRASRHWIGPLQTETMSQPQEPIHIPPSRIISQTQPGKCTCYRRDGSARLYNSI